MRKIDHSRRQFMKTASYAAMAGVSASPTLHSMRALAAMTSQSAPAAAATDYKALVCVYLQGGNDGHGTLIATDPDSFTAFTTARTGAQGLAYPLSTLLPITPVTPQSGRTFALNPYLTGVQSLFNAGRCALIANTGTLIEPITKDQWNQGSAPLPRSLFSHFDQSNAWEAIAADGANVGWGGRMADLFESMNSNTSFTCISTSGTTLFLSGEQAFQLRVTNAGALSANGLTNPLFGSAQATTAMQAIIGADNTNLFAKEYAVVVRRSLAAQAALASAMAPAGPTGVPNPPQFLDPATSNLTTNNLATSLQTVARVIAGRTALGVSRQVFFVELGGFDTHDTQAKRLSTLLSQLGAAFQYFDQLMITAGLSNQVTLFTVSDFGRTLTANSDGTDHGWGSHHIVAGGAVAGQNIYGEYPVIGSNQANDVGAGRLIPTTGVEQYGGTLGRWMGLSDSQIREVFPNFGNFGSNPYLGLMG
jgi:uncharacterized protein (DUF1501 family)